MSQRRLSKNLSETITSEKKERMTVPLKMTIEEDKEECKFCNCGLEMSMSGKLEIDGRKRSTSVCMHRKTDTEEMII